MISDSSISNLRINLMLEKAAIALMPCCDRVALLQHRDDKSSQSFIPRMVDAFPWQGGLVLSLARRGTQLRGVCGVSPVENEHRISCKTGCEL
jgi:hypothetical protein